MHVYAIGTSCCDKRCTSLVCIASATAESAVLRCMIDCVVSNCADLVRTTDLMRTVAFDYSIDQS